MSALEFTVVFTIGLFAGAGLLMLAAILAAAGRSDDEIEKQRRG